MRNVPGPLLLAGLLSVAAGCTGIGMVRLDGSDGYLAAHGEARLAAPRSRCFAAARRVLEGSHGVERADEETGVIVSARKTVHRMVEVTAPTPFGGYGTERISDAQLYVAVTGDTATCRVAVTRLRVWQDLRERDDALRGFARAQLETFTKNLAKELEVEP
jgi:hypothetical protein